MLETHILYSQILVCISCLFSMVRMSFYRVYQCKVSFISALLLLIPTGPTAEHDDFKVCWVLHWALAEEAFNCRLCHHHLVWGAAHLVPSAESIFIGSEDIRAQLPEHSKQFDTIDADFKASSNIKCTVSYVTLQWASLLGLITDQLHGYLWTVQLRTCKHYLCES